MKLTFFIFDYGLNYKACFLFMKMGAWCCPSSLGVVLLIWTLINIWDVTISKLSKNKDWIPQDYLLRRLLYTFSFQWTSLYNLNGNCILKVFGSETPWENICVYLCGVVSSVLHSQNYFLRLKTQLWTLPYLEECFSFLKNMRTLWYACSPVDALRWVGAVGVGPTGW